MFTAVSTVSRFSAFVVPGRAEIRVVVQATLENCNVDNYVVGCGCWCTKKVKKWWRFLKMMKKWLWKNRFWNLVVKNILSFFCMNVFKLQTNRIKNCQTAISVKIRIVSYRNGSSVVSIHDVTNRDRARFWYPIQRKLDLIIQWKLDHCHVACWLESHGLAASSGFRLDVFQELRDGFAVDEPTIDHLNKKNIWFLKKNSKTAQIMLKTPEKSPKTPPKNPWKRPPGNKIPENDRSPPPLWLFWRVSPNFA